MCTHLCHKSWNVFCKTSCMKGFSSIAKYSDCPSGKQKKLYFTDKSRAYMTDLLEYCKAQGVERCFCEVPSWEGDKESAGALWREGAGGVLWLWFASFEGDKELIGINSRDDFYNSEHLNINGSLKFTTYMGNICLIITGLMQTTHRRFRVHGASAQGALTRW